MGTFTENKVCYVWHANLVASCLTRWGEHRWAQGGKWSGGALRPWRGNPKMSIGVSCREIRENVWWYTTYLCWFQPVFFFKFSPPKKGWVYIYIFIQYILATWWFQSCFELFTPKKLGEDSGFPFFCGRKPPPPRRAAMAGQNWGPWKKGRGHPGDLLLYRGWNTTQLCGDYNKPL